LVRSSCDTLYRCISWCVKFSVLTAIFTKMSVSQNTTIYSIMWSCSFELNDILVSSATQQDGCYQTVILFYRSADRSEVYMWGRRSHRYVFLFQTPVARWRRWSGTTISCWAWSISSRGADCEGASRLCLRWTSLAPSRSLFWCSTEDPRGVRWRLSYRVHVTAEVRRNWNLWTVTGLVNLATDCNHLNGSNDDILRMTVAALRPFWGMQNRVQLYSNWSMGLWRSTSQALGN